MILLYLQRQTCYLGALWEAQPRQHFSSQKKKSLLNIHRPRAGGTPQTWHQPRSLQTDKGESETMDPVPAKTGREELLSAQSRLTTPRQPSQSLSPRTAVHINQAQEEAECEQRQVAQWLRHNLGRPHPISECLDLRPSSSFLLMCSLGGSRWWWPKPLSSCHPKARPWELPALVWPNPSYSGHLENAPEDGGYLSISLSLSFCLSLCVCVFLPFKLRERERRPLQRWIPRSSRRMIQYYLQVNFHFLVCVVLNILCPKVSSKYPV